MKTRCNNTSASTVFVTPTAERSEARRNDKRLLSMSWFLDGFEMIKG
jgi:hypothetical protein